jgi:hypothetical protein
MGTDLIAVRKPKLQVGKRDDLKKDNEYIDSYQIWSSWRDSNINTWPEPLQNFWWKINDHDSAQSCAKNIRNYYPYDKELIRFAEWLEKFDTDIIFILSI